MACKKKFVTGVVFEVPETMKCCACGCMVAPGACHCGATNEWAFDPYDGPYQTGSYITNKYEFVPTPGITKWRRRQSSEDAGK